MNTDPITLTPLPIPHLAVDFDYLGGVVHRIYPMLAPEDATERQIREAVRNHFPPDYCQHSYDCCGRYYPNQGQYLGQTYYHDDEGQAHTLVFVLQTWTQNV